MNHDDGAFDSLHDEQSIPRVDSTHDLSKLLPKRSRARRFSKRSAIASIGRSEENGSENSQILFMKETSKNRRGRRSFSEMSCNSGRRIDGQSDGSKDDDKCDAAREELAAGVIDREIYEWQYVCETGRPYWWSPEQKYHRMRKHFFRKSDEHKAKAWMGELDGSPKADYNYQRRAVSDTCHPDADAVHSLAHMTAIQLLSSCFTLPPDHVFGITPPNYPTFDKLAGPIVPDPRMISSLRMHTQFRYSPSFGHQARNTSPVPLWPVSFDGQSRTTPMPTSPGASRVSTWQTPDIGSSGFQGKRNRGVRKLLVAERSSGSSAGDDVGDGQSNQEVLDPTVASTAWHRRMSNFERVPRTSTTSHMPGQSRIDKQRRGDRSNRQSIASSSAADDSAHTVKNHRGVEKRQRRGMNYRMESVIRSEPHHVFVQPVKELVVKKWKNLRRRFGGSLHSPLPSRMSEDNASEISNSHWSRRSSSRMSTDIDGRSRRQRAQERGDIHSSSVDSTVHYNSPVTRSATPAEDGSARNSGWVDSPKPSPRFQLADPLSAAAALAAAETVLKPRSGLKMDEYPVSSSSTLDSNNSLPSSVSTSENTYGKSQSPAFPWPQSSPSTNPYSRRGSSFRKSRLSEVYTPDEFFAAMSPNAEGDREPFERSVFSALGSALATPKEDTPPSLTPLLRPQPSETASSPGPNSYFKRRDAVGKRAQERPKLRRTSTSGTQIFHPSADGVEIDGLPVGPGRETWLSKGRRERTYL